MAKSRSTGELIIDMTRLEKEIDRPPTVADVKQRSKEGKMASPATYFSRLGTDSKTGRQSWGMVLAACSIDIPDGGSGPGRRLSPQQKAERARNQKAKQQAKQQAKDQKAEQKRVARQEAERARRAKEDAEKQAAIAAAKKLLREMSQPISEPIAGRTEMAGELTLVNLTSYPLQLTRHKKSELLQPSGKVEFFSDSFKFLDDSIIDGEINQLFGGIQTKKVRPTYFFVDRQGRRHNFPAPKPGTYYLMPRKTAEYIGATGRTMDDLLFPVQYTTKGKVLVIEIVGVKLGKSPK